MILLASFQDSSAYLSQNRDDKNYLDIMNPYCPHFLDTVQEKLILFLMLITENMQHCSILFFWREDGQH